MDKPLSKLTKKERENIQINKIRNKRGGDITTDTEEIQGNIMSYFKKPVLHKIGKLARK